MTLRTSLLLVALPAGLGLTAVYVFGAINAVLHILSGQSSAGLLILGILVGIFAFGLGLIAYTVWRARSTPPDEPTEVGDDYLPASPRDMSEFRRHGW